MSLTEKQLRDLKKQYPINQYTIKEKDSGLQVIPKKAVIRVFSKQLKNFRKKLYESDSLGKELLRAIDKTGLKKEDFEQQQVTVEKRVYDRITKEAQHCNTRKIIYLQQLLNKVKK